MIFFIHQWVAEGSHLPVQHGDYPSPVVGGEYEIVILKIVVDERAARLAGPVLGQPGRYAIDLGDLVGAGTAIAFRPAFDLPLRLCQYG